MAIPAHASRLLIASIEFLLVQSSVLRCVSICCHETLRGATTSVVKVVVVNKIRLICGVPSACKSIALQQCLMIVDVFPCRWHCFGKHFEWTLWAMCKDVFWWRAKCMQVGRRWRCLLRDGKK